MIDSFEPDGTKRRYRFDLVCPACGKASETVCEWRDLHAGDAGEPVPNVNCGNCLMERVEVVAMKVTSVEVLP